MENAQLVTREKLEGKDISDFFLTKYGGQLASCFGTGRVCAEGCE